MTHRFRNGLSRQAQVSFAAKPAVRNLYVRETFVTSVYSLSMKQHRNFSQALVSPSRRAGGFTAIELMVVVAIVAILTALAVPSFQPLIERWKVKSVSESMQSTIYYARSEAIKRGGNVVIAKTPNTENCTTSANTEWGCGWNVFYDANRNGSQDACVAANTPNECTLQEIAISTRTEINIAGSNGQLTVDRWGVVTSNGVAAGINFDVFAKGRTVADAGSARVCVGSGGRIKQIKGTDSC